ncbi:arginine--tRNA ligase [Lacihabitans sp. CCS-44]|uniref:arginine--tRNA ligase n=1 Tax=Lacihabitans sp. CCS-44 TaxID=2487331 RepID=UPI0020CFA68D|nr:arginine--tRNA ligase [Lacihabitans sp. CCS-44]MCP9753709.1 arginine--tRNA ligase [Lacihabitans sp. CCS-44]
MDIIDILTNKIEATIESLYGTSDKVVLQPTRKEFEGDYTYVFFGLVKSLKKSPPEIGNAIGTALLAHNDIFESFNVVQGFLNLKLKPSVWINVLNDILQISVGSEINRNSASVMVEYSSPNTNKPLHLGHLRNNFLGYSVANILDAAGYDVTKACLVNDRGIHICKSMVAYKHFGNGETPESSGIKGDHLVGKYYVEFDKAYKNQIQELTASGATEDEAKKSAPIMIEAQEMLLKWEQNDAEVIELWKKLNAWVYEGFEKTYKKIGVDFDKTYYESNTYLLGKDLVEDGLKHEIFYKKEDNSVWIDLTDEGLDNKLVLRGDGTSVYITQDLGTTDLKFDDFKSEKSIWVVGNEQDYHFKVLFAIMKKLGRSYADGCYHLSYGMVDLPSGKMKSREGTVVDADELVDEMIATAKIMSAEKGKIEDLESEESASLFRMLALGALKYYLLKVEPKKRMLFNPEESIDFQGNTGPFIQYTHARIKSILRKANVDDKQIFKLEGTHILNREELELVFLVKDYGSVIKNAAAEYSPALIANYTYELAKTFNGFYTQHSVMNEENENIKYLRLGLIKKVAETIKHAMSLLGIDVPERM